MRRPIFLFTMLNLIQNSDYDVVSEPSLNCPCLKNQRVLDIFKKVLQETNAKKEQKTLKFKCNLYKFLIKSPLTLCKILFNTKAFQQFSRSALHWTAFPIQQFLRCLCISCLKSISSIMQFKMLHMIHNHGPILYNSRLNVHCLVFFLILVIIHKDYLTLQCKKMY